VWDGAFHSRAGKGRFLACGAPTLLPRAPRSPAP
jgi:dihydropyrimidinase